MRQSPAQAIAATQVHTEGPVSAQMVEYARDKVSAALRHTTAQVLFVRLTLEDREAARTDPAAARVDVDVNGLDVHARADASTLREAIDLMQDRLRARLARGTGH